MQISDQGPVTNSVASMLAQGATQKKAEHKTNLDAADFQKLFLEQMMHQDPLAPMEQKDMMGQLAQLMEMSRNNETNELLRSMKNIESTRNRLDSGALLGKRVMADASKIEVKDGKGARISWNLPEPGQSVTVDVYKGGTKVAGWVFDSKMTVNPKDANSVKNKKLADEMVGQGVHTVLWDGKDSNDKLVADGMYNVVVRAANLANAPMDKAGPVLEGKITKVGLTGDDVSFQLETKASEDPTKEGESVPIRTDQIYQILP